LTFSQAWVSAILSDMCRRHCKTEEDEHDGRSSRHYCVIGIRSRPFARQAADLFDLNEDGEG
jgi:hypothetical protein